MNILFYYFLVLLIVGLLELTNIHPHYHFNQKKPKVAPIFSS